MIKANLCKCNMCDNTLIDNNPQINAPMFNLIGNEINMKWSATEEAWVCPLCKSDDYLTDIDEQPNNNINMQGLIGQRAYTYTHSHAHVNKLNNTNTR
jgi:hypothetical protein